METKEVVLREIITSANLKPGTMYQCHDDEGHVWYPVVLRNKLGINLVIDLFDMTSDALAASTKGIMNYPEAFIGSMTLEKDGEKKIWSFFPILRPISSASLLKTGKMFDVLEEAAIGKITGLLGQLIAGESYRTYYRTDFSKCHEPGFWNNTERCAEFLTDLEERGGEFVTEKWGISSIADRRNRCVKHLQKVGRLDLIPVRKKIPQGETKHSLKYQRWTDEKRAMFLKQLDELGAERVGQIYGLSPITIPRYKHKFRRDLKK